MGFRSALATLAAAPVLFVALILALPTPAAQQASEVRLLLNGIRGFDPGQARGFAIVAARNRAASNRRSTMSDWNEPQRLVKG